MARRFGESESQFLKGSDLQGENGQYKAPTLVIDHFTQHDFERDNETRTAYVLHFRKVRKGLVLNVTNEETLIQAHGNPPGSDPEDLTRHFAGKPIQLYFDPSVKMAGRRVGGLRLRAVPQAPAAPAPQSNEAEHTRPASFGTADDEPPFPEDEFSATADPDEIPF